MVTNLQSRTKGVVFAADLPTIEETLSITSLISDHIEAVKLGNHLVNKYSISIIPEFKKIRDLPVIADLKLLDVPHTIYSQARLCLESGADGLTVSGLCGVEPISEIVRIWAGRMVFVFNEFTYDGGLIPPGLSNQTAQLARAAGAFGVLAPGTKPHRISELRNIVGADLVIMSCGVGKQGPDYGSAIRVGADYEIIGRSIYLADDPAAEAMKAKNIILEAKPQC